MLAFSLSLGEQNKTSHPFKKLPSYTLILQTIINSNFIFSASKKNVYFVSSSKHTKMKFSFSNFLLSVLSDQYVVSKAINTSVVVLNRCN